MSRVKILLLIGVLFLPFVIAPPQPTTAQTEGYDPVVRIAWNNDGSLLAVGFRSGSLEIRDGETGDLIFSDNSRSELFDFDWSLDNQRLALLQFDGEFTAIVLYDVTTQSTNTLLETTYLIRAVRWSPDDQKIAAIYGSLSDSYWSSDDGVNVWEVAQEELELITSYVQQVGTIAWGPDSTTIALSNSWKYGTQIFDITTDAEIGVLTDHGSFAVDYSPDGTMIASRGNDDELSIYDAESYQELYSFGVIHAGSKIAWGADNQQIVVGGGHEQDENLIVFDIQTGQPTFTLETEPITAVDWSPDGSRIAYGLDREFHIIDALTIGQPTNERQDNSTGVEWKPDGSIVAIGYLHGILQLYDGASGSLIETHFLENGIHEFSWSPVGNKLAIAQGATVHTNRVSIYDISSRNVESSEEINGEYIGEIAWSSDSTYIAVTTAERFTDWAMKSLIVWTVTEDGLTTPQYYDMAPGTIDWRPNSYQLATGTLLGGGVGFIDGSNGHFIKYIDGAATYENRYSPDGSLLAILDTDYNLTIYNADTFQELQQAEIGTSDSISWSPDGQQIAFVKYEDDTHTLMVYDLQTEQLSELFTDESLDGAAWSPVSDQIALQMNHELHLIDAPNDE